MIHFCLLYPSIFMFICVFLLDTLNTKSFHLCKGDYFSYQFIIFYQFINLCSCANLSIKEDRFKCRCHVLFQQSQHREQSQRKADTKKTNQKHTTEPFEIQISKRSVFKCIRYSHGFRSPLCIP